MRGTLHDLTNFWRTPWSQPMREACEWIGDDPPVSGRTLENKLAPRWVRPLFLQQWVTQAIVERLAWLKAHPGVPQERFGQESETTWGHVTWTFAEPWCLREMSEETLMTCFLYDVERLQRILLESPRMVGAVEWTQAALVACGHLAQYYHELRRRQRRLPGQGKALAARAILREHLRQFVTWQPREETAAPSPGG